ncbi:MAG TPA: BMC domain-containing protein [Actinobacteria bacterium]|jgi:microcompartment protein CcmL/EutN|nr:BMC domain-containing protein [Actinomycetota bacterium]
MESSVGVVEFRSIAVGISSVDIIVKASNVSIVDAKTICPGKYYIVFTGGAADVENSYKTIMDKNDDFIIDGCTIMNIYPQLLAALTQTSNISELNAIGVIETLTSPSIFIAADSAVKASDVDLVEIRIARALGGKNFCVINGDISSVKESVMTGIKHAREKDFLVDYQIIASPHPDLYRAIL